MSNRDLTFARAYAQTLQGKPGIEDLKDTPPRIPWLVQVAHCREKCDPKWDVVIATSSQAAAIQWMEENDGWTLPISIRVAPAAPILHHPNGMPMITREFLITESKRLTT